MFSTLRSHFAAWRDYRETVYQLGLLDHRILVDAGIEPGRIRARARAAAIARHRPCLT
ncbi:MAG TPA: DUF1127 domain-containing protein [Devosia sp.]|nr:DUF1127 domain-containing protein [Devosia sp.]